MGRSDVFLKLELIKKGYGLLSLVIATAFFESPIAIALTGIFTSLISCFVNMAPNKKLVNYSYFEQICDILPSFLASAAMLVCVLAVQLLNLSPILTLLIQILVGVVVYVLISAIGKLTPYKLMLAIAKKVLCKKKAGL